jgi:MoxR-like ATPase
VRGRGGVGNGEKSEPTVAAPPVINLTGEDTYKRPNGDLYVARKWGEHVDVAVLKAAREDGLYALLYGAPGCGKTALAEAAFGEDLIAFLGTGDTEVGDLVGAYVPTAREGEYDWVNGPLLEAAIEGKPLLIDEIGLIDPKVLSVVYSLMDGRRELRVTSNPDLGTIKAKDGFFVVAATNPNAPGVILSEALLSRFLIHVEMRTDWKLAKKLGVPREIVTAAQNLDTKVKKGSLDWGPQMRELLAVRDLSKKFGMDWAIRNLIAAAPATAREEVARALTAVMSTGEYEPAVI